MDVYDAAALLTSGPLSFMCVAHNICVPFPDFTRGARAGTDNHAKL
jgi:hypothetical protein